MEEFIYYDPTNNQLVREIFRKKRKAKREQKLNELNTRVYEQTKVNFRNWIDGKDNRIILRILEGRSLKPCDRECEEYALLILKQLNHCSMENFTYYMNDREFLLKAARITEDPYVVENYFYEYINEHLKKNPAFRLEFLKQVMLNDNVYDIKSIDWFVETYGFEAEKEVLFRDVDFYNELNARLNQNPQLPEYKYSGENPKELRRYKNAYNSVLVSQSNKENGLKNILSMFKLPRTHREFDFDLI